LIDRIESTRTADYCLGIIRSICGWYAARHEGYINPLPKEVVKEQQRYEKKPRERTLEDGELRAVWTAAEQSGHYGAIIRLLLLTGQRLEKVASMRWDDVQDGVWNIRTEEREKGNAGRLDLPKIAVDIINAQPRLATNEYVFAAPRGTG